MFPTPLKSLQVWKVMNPDPVVTPAPFKVKAAKTLHGVSLMILLGSANGPQIAPAMMDTSDLPTTPYHPFTLIIPTDQDATPASPLPLAPVVTPKTLEEVSTCVRAPWQMRCVMKPMAMRRGCGFPMDPAPFIKF